MDPRASRTEVITEVAEPTWISNESPGVGATDCVDTGDAVRPVGHGFAGTRSYSSGWKSGW
jgi:hypothetical protein